MSPGLIVIIILCAWMMPESFYPQHLYPSTHTNYSLHHEYSLRNLITSFDVPGPLYTHPPIWEKHKLPS
jgi:hypothetical protein